MRYRPIAHAGNDRMIDDIQGGEAAINDMLTDIKASDTGSNIAT